VTVSTQPDNARLAGLPNRHLPSSLCLQQRPVAEAFVHLHIIDSGAIVASLSSLALVAGASSTRADAIMTYEQAPDLRPTGLSRSMP
jgi:hypothetical protein